MSDADGADRRPLDELFAVLGDPTRRAVLEHLVHDGPQTATELAGHFPSTRQAVVKHLRVLADAGLVAPERSGRLPLMAESPCLAVGSAEPAQAEDKESPAAPPPRTCYRDRSESPACFSRWRRSPTFRGLLPWIGIDSRIGLFALP